jgi:hypothetical protein
MTTPTRAVYQPEADYTLLANAIYAIGDNYGTPVGIASPAPGGTVAIYVDDVAAGGSLQFWLQESYDHDPAGAPGNGHWSKTASIGLVSPIVAKLDGGFHVTFNWPPAPYIRALATVAGNTVTFEIHFFPMSRARLYS